MENTNNIVIPTNTTAQRAVVKMGKTSTYYRQKRLRKQAIARAKKKYGLMVLTLLVIPAVIMGYHGLQLDREQKDVQAGILQLKTTQGAVKHENKELTKELQTMMDYENDLKKLGSMGQAIKLATEEFGKGSAEINKLRGLMIGIANAESSLGTKYHVAYDVKCHNWWGLKGGNMARRGDGSSLRCFVDDVAGARTMAKTLKLYYLNEGKDTPEEIVKKYVGQKWGIYHDQWVANVKKYTK